MQTSKWHPDAPLTNDDEPDAPWPSSLNVRADWFGVGSSLLVLCVALAMMMMQLIFGPSFEKCSALESQSERYICYDQLREQLLRHPAKGANAPALDKSN